MSTVTVVLVWQLHGVPEAPGRYLVELETGRHEVWEFNTLAVGWRPSADSYADRSNTRFRAWARVPNTTGARP